MMRPSCEETVVIKVRDLHNKYFSMTLGPYSRAVECRPGSFIHVRLPSSNLLFRRAMSVANVDPSKGQIEIIFKVFGRGTEALSHFRHGDKLDILGPLGVPFTLAKKGERTIMIAGGVGFPPLYFLAATMIVHGYNARKIHFFYGARTSGELVERSRIRKLGVNLHFTTDDGSFGTCGLITKPLQEFIEQHRNEKLRIYACGPEAMLKATNELGVQYHIPGQISLEAPMPCGIGVCLGCVVPMTAGGYARVCCEGPVFNIGEVRL